MDTYKLSTNMATLASSISEFTTREEFESSYHEFILRNSIVKKEINHKMNLQVLYNHQADQYLNEYDVKLYKECQNKEEVRETLKHNTWKKEGVEKVLQQINDELPEYFQLIETHIKYIVMDSLTPYGSASASDSLGVFSIVCKNEYDSEDIIEMIIHELTHNLLFIDNLNDSYFSQEVDIEKIKVNSPIRKENRQIHKSLHALIVAIELLNLRSKRNRLHKISKIHPDTKDMIISCKKTITEMQNIKNVFTEYGENVLVKSKDVIDAIEKRL